MERFSNQPLRPQPHLAVFSSSKVGNFVVTIPLLRGLKEKYPGCTLDFFGSEITADFEQHCPYIDAHFPLHTRRADFLMALSKHVNDQIAQFGPYDLAINCDEFSELNLVAVTALRPQYLAGGGLTIDFRRKLDSGSDPVQRMLADDQWNSLAFLERHRDLLTSNYIGEIFCRLAYVETDFLQLELPAEDPGFEVPDVLVHITTTRRAKMWGSQGWLELIHWCQTQGLSVGLVGSAPAKQQELYHSDGTEDDLLAQTQMIDLRGKTSLIQLAGAFQRAKACVSVDAGPLHIAAAVGCPTVGLFGNDADGVGASPLHLWAPRLPHVRIPRSEFRCDVCWEQRFKNETCLVEGHPCMAHLQTHVVIEALSWALNVRDPNKDP
jgi:ADP-heptose:LPS heptosyltransferase